MFAPLLAAAGLAGCVCQDARLCQPLSSPLPPREVLAFSPSAGNWKHYNFTSLTTIVKFGDHVPELMCVAHAAGVRVIYHADFPNDKLGDPAYIDAWAANVSAAVKAGGYDGFNFDVEGNRAHTAGLTSLVAKTATLLRRDNPLAQVTFDSAIYGQPAGYDYKALAEHIDFFVPMGYDMCWGTKVAEPNAPISGLVSGIRKYKEMGLLSKVVLGLPWYGWNFPCESPSPSGGCDVVTPFGGAAWQIGFDTAQGLEQKAVAPAAYTPANDARFFSYVSNNQTHQVYYDDAKTLAQKYALAGQFGLRGVAVWHVDCALSAGGASLWKALEGLKQ